MFLLHTCTSFCRFNCTLAKIFIKVKQVRRVFEDNVGVHFSLFLHKNICCEYSLESPCPSSSNEYPQHMFLRRTIENYPLIITKYPFYLYRPPLKKLVYTGFALSFYHSVILLLRNLSDENIKYTGYPLLLFPWNVLKLCRCFLHGMKMCMWFGYNPVIIFSHLFCFVN